jgi:hypothetical protein
VIVENECRKVIHAGAIDRDITVSRVSSRMCVPTVVSRVYVLTPVYMSRVLPWAVARLPLPLLLRSMLLLKLQPHQRVDEVRTDAHRVELDAAARVGATVSRTAAREVEAVHLALDAGLGT